MRRGLSFLMALIIGISITVSAAADELTDSKNKLNNANKSISEHQEKIKDIENTQKDTQQQIKGLDEKMNQLAAEVDKLRDSISVTTEQINTLTAEIDAKVSEVEKQQELLNQRLRALYMKGSLGYMSVILGSKNLSDLVQRTIYVEKVVDSDKNLIAALEESRKQLEADKETLNQKKTELSSAQTNSKLKLSQLDQQSDDKKAFMTQLEKDKKEYQKLLDEEAAEANILKDKIKKLEAVKISNGKLFCVTGRPYSVTSPYGNRYHPILKQYRFHSGIDIGVYFGSPIYALKDGVVVYAGEMSGYGNVVMINHGDVISLYAHLSSIVIKEGASVKGGQLISYSGNSGLSTGPHLHFEIRNLSGDTINPINYYVK